MLDSVACRCVLQITQLIGQPLPAQMYYLKIYLELMEGRRPRRIAVCLPTFCAVGTERELCIDVHCVCSAGESRFPQIDIIGAVVIVWRVRGKIIRSVLYNIVCNNCAQCDAHTFEQTNNSLDWVLSHWAHFTVLRFIFIRSSPRR